MRKETDQQTEEQEVPAVEELTAEDGIVDPSYTLKIHEFLEKQKIDISQPVFYLYRYENYNSGEAKALIAKYKDGDPPDEDDIGRQYGSGRYLLVMSIPRMGAAKTGVRAYRFRVHPVYDKLRDSSPGYVAGPNMPVPYPVIQKESGNNLLDAITIIERLITAMVPMFNQPKEESVSSVLEKSYGAMGDMMKKSMMNNLSLINDVQRKMLLVGGDMDVDDELLTEAEEPSIIQQIAPLLSEWLPLILGKGPQATVAQKAVQMTPQFQQIVNNRAELIKLVRFFDQEKGTAETDKILAALKIRRPGGSARTPRRRAPVKKTAAGK